MKSKFYSIVKKICNYLKKLAMPCVKLFTITRDYTGTGAETVKIIPVLMIFFLITYPLWSLPVYIWLAVTYGEPLNYILYVLWVMQLVVVILINAYLEYLRKHKSE